MRYLSVLRIDKLLQTIHPLLQPDSYIINLHATDYDWPCSSEINICGQYDKIFSSKVIVEANNKGFGMGFLTLGAQLVYIELKQTFSMALIFCCVNPKCYIKIETNVSSYAICGIFCQVTFDNFSQWHLIAYFSPK